METEGRANRVGPKAIAVPGNLKAWCEVAERFGRLGLPTLVAPAIRHASRGFGLTPYLATCIPEIALDLALDGDRLGLPAGRQAAEGRRPAGAARLRRRPFARSLKADPASCTAESWGRNRRLSRKGRLVHPTGGPSQLQDDPARTGPRHLSRRRDCRPRPALLGRRAYRPDPQHARSLRRRRRASARPRHCISCWKR